MYWISGAFRAVRWAPPPRSSEIAPFSTAFPPVPTAFPEDVPTPRPASGFAFAMTIFPREGGISRSELGGAGTGGSGPSGGRGGTALGRGTGDSFPGGRAGLTGRSGTRPASSLGGGTGGFSFRAGFGGGGGGGFGRAPSAVPRRGGGG